MIKINAFLPAKVESLLTYKSTNTNHVSEKTVTILVKKF